jgi:hypothetical protein
LAGILQQTKAPQFPEAPFNFNFLERSLVLGLRLGAGIVLLVIDILGSSVLFLIDLLLLTRGQLSAVRGTIRRNLLVDSFLLVFQLGGFAGRQLAALDALSDAVLMGSVALAQTPATTPAADPTIGQRKENQQDRIANGVKSDEFKPVRKASVFGFFDLPRNSIEKAPILFWGFFSF